MTSPEASGRGGIPIPCTGSSIGFDAERRRFLGVGIAVFVGILLGDPATGRALVTGGSSIAGEEVTAGGASTAAAPSVPRSLSFFNTHTGERLETVYWCEGAYRPEALGAIDHILRDHRTEEVKKIDPGLLDVLHSIRTTIGSETPFHVISGYRSPATNAELRLHERGVAAGSLHMTGRAIDIRLPGTRLQDLRGTARALKAGGIGYYPASDFVHVDTGRVREW
jgi:uncharacterized protein YcbK (DUF882 family)